MRSRGRLRRPVRRDVTSIENAPQLSRSSHRARRARRGSAPRPARMRARPPSAARRDRGRRGRRRRRRRGRDAAGRARRGAIAVGFEAERRELPARDDPVLARREFGDRRVRRVGRSQTDSFVDPPTWPEDDGEIATCGAAIATKRARKSTDFAACAPYNTRNVGSDVSRATIEPPLSRASSRYSTASARDAEALEDHRDPGRIDLDDLGRDLPDRLAQRHLVADRLRVAAAPSRVHHGPVVDRRERVAGQALARAVRAARVRPSTSTSAAHRVRHRRVGRAGRS